MSDFQQTHDTGTGAVKNPMEKPVTYNSEDHDGAPTGVVSTPESTTHYFDTTDEPKEDAPVEKQVTRALNKAVKSAKRK